MFNKRRLKRKIDIDEVISDTLSGSEFKMLERPINRRVFFWAGASISLVILILLSRVVFLSGVKGTAYAERADDNMHQTIPLVAPRGIITDRNGVPLVKNEPIFSVFLHVDRMIRNKEQEAVLKAAQDILALDEEKVIKLIQNADLEDIGDIIIANEVDREQVIAIESLDIESLNVEESYKRSYIDPAYSHVVGYVGLVSDSDLEGDEALVLNDSIGRSGLELEYDHLLRGENGRVTIFRNSVGDISEIVRTREPIHGQSLKTTIDIELQDQLYESMISGLRSLNRTSGAGIVVDPRNGEILAMVSLPAFDGNNVADSLGNSNQPLFNRVVAGVYNPGSTIKPIHAASALHEGVVEPTDQFYSAGYIEIPNPYNPDQPSRFVDWKPHGWVDAYSAIARSSNVYFYIVGGGFQDQEGLGIDRLNKYWNKFGLGTPTNIDMPGEASGFLPTVKEKEDRTGDIWRIGDTYNITIGQGDLTISPIRLITAISAIANGGLAYQPHLSKEIKPDVSLDLQDMAGAFSDVRQGMRDGATKDYGTANLLANIPMEIGAKTGSAQVAGKTKTNALFVGYGARDTESQPEIAVLILIEDAVEGSLNAVPIARDVFRWYYENKVAPKDNDAETE